MYNQINGGNLKATESQKLFSNNGFTVTELVFKNPNDGIIKEIRIFENQSGITGLMKETITGEKTLSCFKNEISNPIFSVKDGDTFEIFGFTSLTDFKDFVLSLNSSSSSGSSGSSSGGGVVNYTTYFSLNADTVPDGYGMYHIIVANADKDNATTVEIFIKDGNGDFKTLSNTLTLTAGDSQYIVLDSNAIDQQFQFVEPNSGKYVVIQFDFNSGNYLFITSG